MCPKSLYILLISVLCLHVSCVEKHEDYKKNESKEKKAFIFNETKLRFMDIDKCDTLKASFTYFNYTNNIQYIDTIKTSCGCIEVKYDHKPIRPHESGKIEVKIDIRDNIGFFSKTLAVYFHNHEPIILKVMGKTKTDEHDSIQHSSL